MSSNANKYKFFCSFHLLKIILITDCESGSIRGIWKNQVIKCRFLMSESVILEDVRSIEKSGYSVTISRHIHARLERHVLILKKLLDKGATKQNWMISAIKEKLARDLQDDSLPKATTITLKIDKELDEELNARVEFIKKFRQSYSRKQWIVDAVIEKLDLDERKVEEKFLSIKPQ